MDKEVEDIIAVRGKFPGTWVYYYKEHTYHAHEHYKKKKTSPTIEFGSAPPGQYRCTEYRNCNCNMWVYKYENNKIKETSRNDNERGHLHALNKKFINKVKLYKRLREIATKENIPAHKVISIAKEGPEFNDVDDYLNYSTLNAVVKTQRNKLDKQSQVGSMSDFYSSVDHLRQSKNILLGKLKTDEDNNNAIFFGSSETQTYLQQSKKLHFQFQRDIHTEFSSNMLIIHVIEETISFPVIFVIYKWDSHNLFKKIMSYLIDYAPDMKNVDIITSELSDMVINVLRRFFPTTQIRCTLFYYQKEITQSWIDFKLPFELEYIKKNKTLRYAWALPLSILGKKTFNDSIKILEEIKEETDATTMFVKKLKERWLSRIKNILVYSTTDKHHHLAEASEHSITMDFSLKKKNTIHVLDKINNYISKIGVKQNFYVMLPNHARTRIAYAGVQLHDEKWSLEEFLENCLTSAAQESIHRIMQLEQPYTNFKVTADIRDLDDIDNSIDENSRRFKKSHHVGPSNGQEKRRLRLNNLDNILDSVVTQSSTKRKSPAEESSNLSETNITELNSDDEIDETIKPPSSWFSESKTLKEISIIKKRKKNSKIEAPTYKSALSPQADIIKDDGNDASTHEPALLTPTNITINDDGNDTSIYEPILPPPVNITIGDNGNDTSTYEPILPPPVNITIGDNVNDISTEPPSSGVDIDLINDSSDISTETSTSSSSSSFINQLKINQVTTVSAAIDVIDIKTNAAADTSKKSSSLVANSVSINDSSVDISTKASSQLPSPSKMYTRSMGINKTANKSVYRRPLINILRNSQVHKQSAILSQSNSITTESVVENQIKKRYRKQNFDTLMKTKQHVKIIPEVYEPEYGEKSKKADKKQAVVKKKPIKKTKKNEKMKKTIGRTKKK